MELLVDWMEIMYRFWKDQYNKKLDHRNEYIETNNNKPIQDTKNQLEKESIPSFCVGDDNDGDSSANENDPGGRRTKIVEETIPNLPKLFKENIFLITQMFDNRVKSFIKNILLKSDIELYSQRIEYQIRGMPVS